MAGRPWGTGGRATAGVAVIAALLLSTACTENLVPSPSLINTQPATSGQPPSPGPTEPPYHRSFGPLFAADPPIGGLVRIDGAFLSHDRRTLSVEFVGSHAYLPTNPCSKDYQAWASIQGDALVVEVVTVTHPDQETLAPEVSCTMEGYSYLFAIDLPVPFVGSTVRNGSEPLWVPTPERVAELASLPGGWQLARISTFADAEPELHELLREYVPEVFVKPGSSLGLGQVFGGPSGWDLHDVFTSGVVRGQDVPIGRNGDIGYTVNWELNGDSMTLISYDPELSVEEFIAMANGVAIPSE
jgi:hypothetical protein